MLKRFRHALLHTRLGQALLAWMGLMVAFALVWGLILKTMRYEVLPLAVAALFIGALILLAWMAGEMFARRGSALWAFAAFLAFLALYAPAVFTLYPVGLYLAFLPEQARYEAIVADAKAGRLGFDWGRHGCLAGTSRGMTYSSIECGRPEISFPWTTDAPGVFHGVVYSEVECPRPARKPEPPMPAPSPGEPPVIKHAGEMGARIHLTGHYCYYNILF